VKAQLKLVEKNSAPPAQTSKPVTPCVRNCCLDDSQICLGCGRSLPEILEWHNADNVRQSQIIDQASDRLLDKKQN